MFDDVIILRGFVLRGGQLYGLIQQIYQIGESVAEKPADADGDVDAGAAQLGQRYDRQARHAAAFRLPYRADAEQVQDLGEVVAVGSHSGRSPYHQAHHFGVGAFLRQVLVQQRCGQLLAGFPSGRGGDGLGVNGIEIASGGQDVRHSAGGGAAGAGRHELAGQPAQQVADFVGRAHQRGIHRFGYIFQHRLGRGVGLAQYCGHRGRGGGGSHIAGQHLAVGLAA